MGGDSLKNNLIIKSSYSQLANGELKSNYGDLVRTAILAQCIDGDYLWLTEARSIPLLKWIIDPKKIIAYEDFNGVPSDLEIYSADNYVPSEDIYNQLEGNWHGYIWDKAKLVVENDKIRDTVAYSEPKSDTSWQQSLVEGMGFPWEEQDYPTPPVKNLETVDIGLNWNVHPDWTSKMWPEGYWNSLMKNLSRDYSVSWQRGLNDFDEYMEWMNSCRLIITVETLGLHLASALKKQIIALLGPVSSSEYSYGRITTVKPSPRECMPCNAPVCRMEHHCMNDISVESISEMVSNKLEHGS